MSAPLGPSFPICWEQYHLADCEPVNAYVYICGACSIIQASHVLGSVCTESHACSPPHEHSRNRKSVHTYVLPSKQHVCVVPSRREGLGWSRARPEKCSGQPFKEAPAPALVRALYTSLGTLCVPVSSFPGRKQSWVLLAPLSRLQLQQPDLLDSKELTGSSCKANRVQSFSQA